ncbi:hypothetical protein, partial [Enterobacter mori]
KQVNRFAPTKWQYRAGVIVVVICAVMVVMLVIYPQRVFYLVQRGMPLFKNKKTPGGGFFYVFRHRPVVEGGGGATSPHVTKKTD